MHCLSRLLASSVRALRKLPVFGKKITPKYLYLPVKSRFCTPYVNDPFLLVLKLNIIQLVRITFTSR